MSWAKLDDEILDNGKIVKAGSLGLLLHVAGITWCARNLTDGLIPKHKVRCLLNLTGVYVDRGNDAALPITGPNGNGAIDHPVAERIAEHLAAADLWHDRGDAWEIHDYLDYNPSREEVLARREHSRTKKQRQRRRRGSPAESPQGTAPGSPDAVPTHPVPVPVPEEKSKKTSSPLKRGTRNAKWHRVPEGEQLTPERRGMGIKVGLAPSLIDPEWEKYLDHEYRVAKSDVNAAWRNWCRIAAARQQNLAAVRSFTGGFGARA